MCMQRMEVTGAELTSHTDTNTCAGSLEETGKYELKTTDRLGGGHEEKYPQQELAVTVRAGPSLVQQENDELNII